MRFTSEAHPGRSVRLAYCMNVHAAETEAEFWAGIEGITLPLRERLCPGGSFGVGMYLPARLARRLCEEGVGEFARRLEGEGLDPFTFNAFPYGGFHRDGLKEGVYRPTWLEPERWEYTRDVLSLAQALWSVREWSEESHLSISTHPGSYGPWIAGPADRHALARGFARVAEDLVGSGPLPVVLSLEAEPRASAGDQRELAEFLAVLRVRAGEGAGCFGTCLDTCHSAVEFEGVEESLALATHGGPLGKLQFSSALSLLKPGEHPAGVRALVALDEPRYLHQVTGIRAGRRMGVTDLGRLPWEDGDWLACDEWRCHFHVPVDLGRVEELGTTRGHAEATLRAALARPEGWGVRDLHLEIETYTWEILPGSVRGSGELIDGLEREYRVVLEILEEEGWRIG